MNNELHFSSAKDDWATPPDLFAQLNSEFHFTLDAAASKVNTLVPSSYYGLDHPDPERRDGLAARWTGVVWCNPPYGREVGKWIERGRWDAHDGATVVMLLPARTDTRWFHLYCVHGEVRFIKGRLTFGGAPAPAPFPSMIVIWRAPSRPYRWSVL